MKVLPIQFETFGATPKNSIKTAKKGYSVIIGEDMYLVGGAGKDVILTPFKSPNKQFAGNNKLNNLNCFA